MCKKPRTSLCHYEVGKFRRDKTLSDTFKSSKTQSLGNQLRPQTTEIRIITSDKNFLNVLFQQL